MLKRLMPLLILLPAITVPAFPQSFISPNVAMKSHPTLEIMKVELSAGKTEVYMKIENRITGGYFCADRNIYIVYPDGTRDHLVSSSGIPVCPDTYKFKSIGEQLDFVLTFPPLREGAGSVNLIEDCEQNCFSFYGVVLDSSLNRKLDDAFLLAENNEPSKALVSLVAIAGETGNSNPGAAGLLFMNIIQLYKSTGNSVKAGDWYRKLQSSGLPETAVYIKHLNSLGISY